MRRVFWALLLTLLLPLSLAAQGGGGADVLAEVLGAEDARRYDESLLRRALGERDSVVRLAAVQSLGRLQDPRGLVLLQTVLNEPDTALHPAAVFAVGLIGDSAGTRLLLQLIKDRRTITQATWLELVTALARLGGPEAGLFLRDVIEGSRESMPALTERAALESWRLGKLAPTAALIPLLGDSRDGTRYAAAYSLARLRSTAAASRFLEGLRDPSPLVRATAARALTRTYADSARLGHDQVADLLVRAVGDPDPSVRVQALRSLASYHLPRTAGRVLSLVEDQVPNVQVQAVQALGEIGGPEAALELERLATGSKGSWARRMESLASLARVDSIRFHTAVSRWSASTEWRDRAAAARSWAEVRVSALRPFLEDPDARVSAAALEAWGGAVPGPDPELLRAAGIHLGHRDAAVRAIAAELLARSGNPADIPRLVAAVGLAARDTFPDAATKALEGITTIARANPSQAENLEGDALASLARPSDPVILRWARDNWPAAAEAWGSPWPIATGRTLEDYRSIVRTFLLGTPAERAPTVRMEVDQLGVVELRLFGNIAPLTVANFLRLVDRHYFDGLRFHRVIPNFVVQAGDPRGDGWGGPGNAIRDEINRERYDAYVVGMALSGPDTGGSQWFITLSPQPHLDGLYTVFGEVLSGKQVVARITQGDLIRVIRR